MSGVIDKIIENNEKWDDTDYCLRAVKKNGSNLALVKKQTPEICLAAVKQDRLSLQFVREQTPEICAEAIKRNSTAYEYMRLPRSKQKREKFLRKLGLLLLTI